MKKIIQVIKYNGEYIEDYEYSQGYLSETTTKDVLRAYDLNSGKGNPEFAKKCYLPRGATLETYEVTLTFIPTEPK